MRRSRLKTFKNVRQEILGKDVIESDADELYYELTQQQQIFSKKVTDEEKKWQHAFPVMKLELMTLMNEIKYAYHEFKTINNNSNFQTKDLLGVFANYDDIFDKVNRIHFEVQNNSFDVTIL